MNKFRMALTVLIAGCGAIFALRHHSLRQLQAGQEQLRQQIAEVAALRAEAARTRPAGLSSINTALSAEERSELLRLRGGVGRLRQQLAQLTNQIAVASQTQRPDSSNDTEERPMTRGEQIKKMNRGRDMILSLITAFNEKGHRLPPSLAEAALAAGYQKNVDDFELLQPGMEWSSLQSPNRTLVLREKRPWKSASGRWGRVYAFADGHTEFAYSTNQDFSEWEAKYENPAKQNE